MNECNFVYFGCFCEFLDFFLCWVIELPPKKCSQRLPQWQLFQNKYIKKRVILSKFFFYFLDFRSVCILLSQLVKMSTIQIKTNIFQKIKIWSFLNMKSNERSSAEVNTFFCRKSCVSSDLRANMAVPRNSVNSKIFCKIFELYSR